MFRFDFTLKHMLGTRMGKANDLSRRLDWKMRVEKNNENQKLIKEEWIKGIMEVVVEAMLMKEIKWARRKNKKVVEVVKEMKKAGIKKLRDDE